jgi:hypothetical protein
MATFSNAVAQAQSKTISRTENGMKAFATSDSAILDLFGKIGSGRGRDMTREFMAALGEDESLAIRILLWARDVRGGAGERGTFRSILSKLEDSNPTLAGRIMHKVPVLGRWDDLFTYRDPINRKAALRMYADALMDSNGLAAKWAPREKSTKKAIAVELRNFMQVDPKTYRKMLVENTNVVETQMCAKEWDGINFSHVPSVASARYQKAFGRNAGEQYAAYIRELQKPDSERDPKVKINAGAVYPYDVVKSLRHGSAAVADAQFKALPNYVGDTKILPMVDVSGSMGVPLAGNTTAMDVAISLGLYLSDRTSSDFKNMFLTFSGQSKIQTLKGTLSQKFMQLSRSEWGMNTNLHSAFNEILSVAKNGNVSPENMPDYVLILSDMQFDSCVRNDHTALEMIKSKYAQAGYTMPKVVFWNLTARAENTPVKTNDQGVALVSGFSPAIMATVLGADPSEFSPWNMMMQVIMNERYDY